MTPTSEFTLKSRIIAEGRTTLIVSVGDMLDTVLKAVTISGKHPTIIDVRFIQPFDFDTFYHYAETHEKIIFIEEGVWGGLSSIVTEKLFGDGKQWLFPRIQFLTATKVAPQHTSRDGQLNSSCFSVPELATMLRSN